MKDRKGKQMLTGMNCWVWDGNVALEAIIFDIIEPYSLPLTQINKMSEPKVIVRYLHGGKQSVHPRHIQLPTAEG